MAVTAAITLSSATATAPGTVVATCTVTNSNSTNCNVTGLFPKLTVNGKTAQSVAGELGTAPLGPGMTTVVLASGGTLAISFNVRAYAPTHGTTALPGNPVSVVYDVGADVYTNASGADALVTATTTTLTVSGPTN